MEVTLIDTSVWINFFKGFETSATLYLKSNLGIIPIATCPTVLQETLQGLKSQSEANRIESYFDDMIQLVNDPYELAIEAAQLYRKLRKNGITVRKPNDCLIATYAIKNKIPILHDDVDFTNIAQKTNLLLVNTG
ncbi:type II toxin-antitoxin system VapC family toxin [Mucilaginibacter terrae]|uniref:Nucleic acid-binding protein n=1 Tax=Mucilaginibacter terrae TaxID=1955052 RepID=A0ABU3GTG0_9SPHI|nr:PIN domain-containing protein [Mucilaginibacter terrae]MDT3402726.1 putative nucleic acid-binding protein [Mucilaginibacter terrae]